MHKVSCSTRLQTIYRCFHKHRILSRSLSSACVSTLQQIYFPNFSASLPANMLRHSYHSSANAAFGCDAQAGAHSEAAYPGDSTPHVYFVTTRNFCDHLLFHDDGRFFHGSTFAKGPTDGHGEWELVERFEDNVPSHQLRLRWSVHGTISGSTCIEVSSTDGSMRLLRSADASLRLVQGSPLRTAAMSQRSRRGLVFSSVGSQCLPVVRDHWLRSPSKMEFDVALVFYKDASSEVFAQLEEVCRELDGVELLQREGMKWPNFRYWMDLHGGRDSLLSAYDYVWVVDDDVRLETTEINQLFDLLREHSEISVACPSFDAGSDGVWRFFDGHDPRYKLRYTNFVECTAPVLKTSFIVSPMFAPCLRAVRTGCFLDFCFYHAAGGRKDAVAVIDAVQAHHPPRGENEPSEMRQVQAWHDHRQDDVLFEREGVPKEWWAVEPRFFQPQVFGGILAGDSRSVRRADGVAG
eukprot:TRINITY_DN20107_c0_g1_i2.p1 TRINITY_DN20107_c0_g1~~TRINITY_DN20107_c0_g1_i2.p1  ORF type:complete len:465 (-),score=54.28 TRINITY_DN20107_c0_g1_i2:77-1471(-)